MKKIVLNALAIFMSAMSFSQTFTVDYITYEVTSVAPNTAKVTAYDVAGGTSVSIPATINNASIDYEVTNIGVFAFMGKGLTNITLPNTLVEIGPSSLAYNNLTSIDIPNSVEVIRSNALSNNNITSIVIPESVVNIQVEAFRQNPITTVFSERISAPALPSNGTPSDAFTDRSLINLFIPNGAMGSYVTDSGAKWTGFAAVTQGNTIEVDHVTYDIVSIDPNVLQVVDYDVTNGGTDLTIPGLLTHGVLDYDVTSIVEDAFNSIGLTSVAIQDGVQTIGYNAFRANQLTSLVLPNSITTIGYGAFESNDLTSIVFSDNLSVIESNVFALNALTNLVIPEGITSIGLGTFQGNQLTQVTFPNSIIEIGIASFINNQLTDIVIPANVVNIGNQAFRNNPLANVTSVNTVPPNIVTGGTIDSFAQDRSAINLFIPTGTTGAYVTDPGALWTGFNMVTEDSSLGVETPQQWMQAVQIVSENEALRIRHSNAVHLQTFQLYSLDGTRAASGEGTTISTHQLASGLYVAHLWFDRGMVTKKVLVY